MILKRLLSPLPHPSSHLPYGAASCPLFIFAVGFEWQGDKQGWWRVLFAAVGLIDRWGVGGGVCVLRSARCVTPFKLDEKQYVNFTHTIPVRLWPTAEMTPWIPEAVWPLVMKSLLFLCCWCWPLRAGNDCVLWFALTLPPLQILNSQWQCWNTMHCSLAYFSYTVNTCSLWLIQWPTATLNQ